MQTDCLKGGESSHRLCHYRGPLTAIGSPVVLYPLLRDLLWPCSKYDINPAKKQRSLNLVARYVQSQALDPLPPLNGW